MHTVDPQNELLQCYDEDGTPTDARIRAEVKQWPPRYWYAVARVWLVNDQAQLMCSRRADELLGNPGKWQTYFGGHVGAEHSIQETARRELEEEAGVKRPIEDFFLVDKGRIDEKKVFFESFAVRFNGQPSDLLFSDHEVTEALWMDMDEYWKEKENHPDTWCNGCPQEIQQCIRKWIASV